MSSVGAIAARLVRLGLIPVRLALIPAVFLAFIPYAIEAGGDPGFVLRRDVPYPVGHVVGVIALLAVESVVLFVMLRPMTYRLAEWRRGLKVLGLVVVAFFFEPMMTDMPGYVYVNAAFLFTWFVILGIVVVVGSVSYLIWPAKVGDSDHAA